jgi:hypothetical protein
MQDVSELITALEGAAVNAAAGAANRAAGEAAAASVPNTGGDPSTDPVLTEQVSLVWAS